MLYMFVCIYECRIKEYFLCLYRFFRVRAAIAGLTFPGVGDALTKGDVLRHITSGDGRWGVAGDEKVLCQDADANAESRVCVDEAKEKTGKQRKEGEEVENGDEEKEEKEEKEKVIVSIREEVRRLYGPLTRLLSHASIRRLLYRSCFKCHGEVQTDGGNSSTSNNRSNTGKSKTTSHISPITAAMGDDGSPDAPPTPCIVSCPKCRLSSTELLETIDPFPYRFR